MADKPIRSPPSRGNAMSKVYDASGEFKPFARADVVKFHPNKHLNKPHPVSGKHGQPRRYG